MQPHRGTQVLVFGILSLVVCPFFGIAAWSMGNADLQDMAAGRMEASGRDMTQAGRICGMVGTAIAILQVLIIIIAVFSMVMFGSLR